MSDEGRTIATSLDTVDAGDAEAPDWHVRLARSLADVAARESCDMIVVGLPRALSGRDTHMTRDVRAVAAALEDTGWPVELWDERLSSAEAERVMLASGTRRRARRAARDRVAATLILQGWLDARGGA